MAEAVSSGFCDHKTIHQKYPRLQLRTVKDLMESKSIERPSSAWRRRPREGLFMFLVMPGVALAALRYTKVTALGATISTGRLTHSAA